MGYVPPRANEMVIVLLCRRCLFSNCNSNEDIGLGGQKYDAAAWSPLIDENRCLVDWLVHRPTDEEVDACRMQYHAILEARKA